MSTKKPVPLPREAVVEKTLGGYILPDHAVDLSAWLRDGLEVYNLFVQMKPLFFQMLEALGGEFTMSGKKEREDHLAYRVRVSQERVEEEGRLVDVLTTATLTRATGVTEDFAPLPPLGETP